MQVQVNEKNEITGYAVLGGFPGGVETEALPEGFQEGFVSGKYLYRNGEIKENPDYTPAVDNSALLEGIASMKAELAATDYKALKYMEGWLTEEEYAPVKARRQEIRDKINELEAQF